MGAPDDSLIAALLAIPGGTGLPINPICYFLIGRVMRAML
jgi:hypothetical protein